MLITELTINECRAILKETNLGRLACVRYSQPYSCADLLRLFR